ncbi:MAG: hypothetical protein AB8B55_14975 [Mariniblastus sp.]
MHQPSVFFVGHPEEVSHHAAPFRKRLNIQIADPERVSPISKPGDLAIFFSEHFDRFRNCCQQLQKQNVATLYMVDGILEWRNAWENRADEVACPYTMRPVLADKVACIGESQARILRSWGNTGKTEIVGIPRLDSGNNTGKRKPNRSQSFGENATFRVLVMTAKTPGFTPEQVATTKQSLLDLKSWLDKNSTLNQVPIEFVWRLTGGLSSDIGVENNLSDLTGKELGEVLNQVDAVITTPSTAMLEAMLLDLPVAVLDYHNCPHYVNAGWDICKRDHIGPAIRQMADRVEKRMLFQRTELDNALYVADSGAPNATDRIVELCNSMLSIASDQIANGASVLNFPAHILQPVSTRTSKFCHELAYPDAAEFAEKDLTLNQVELSHARREIVHLQKEMAQLQSELDQAHQIFETIEKHPIAGPVVRIRQKMLDLMSAIRIRKNKLESPNKIETRTN